MWYGVIEAVANLGCQRTLTLTLTFDHFSRFATGFAKSAIPDRLGADIPTLGSHWV
jgi:hypothetical protein